MDTETEETERERDRNNIREFLNDWAPKCDLIPCGICCPSVLLPQGKKRET